MKEVINENITLEKVDELLKKINTKEINYTDDLKKLNKIDIETLINKTNTQINTTEKNLQVLYNQLSQLNEQNTMSIILNNIERDAEKKPA